MSDLGRSTNTPPSNAGPSQEAVRVYLGWAISGAMLLVLLGLTLVIWKMERITERATTESQTSDEGSRIGHDLDTGIFNLLRPLRRRWYGGRLATEEGFVTAAKPLTTLTTRAEFVGWVDEAGVCKQAFGKSASSIIGKQMDQPFWSELLARARLSSSGAGSLVTVDPKYGPTACCAFCGTDGRPDAPQTGAIIAQYRLSPIFNDVVKTYSRDHFILELTDSDRVFFSDRADGAVAASNADAYTQPVPFQDRLWLLRLSPTQAYADRMTVAAPHWAIWAWLFGSGVLFLGVWMGILRQRINVRRQHDYLNALEKVAETSAAILVRVGSSDDLWRQLAEAARSLMSMSMAAIVLLEDDGNSLRFITNVGAQSMAGSKFRLEDLRSAQLAVEQGKAIACSDVRKSQLAMNRTMADQYGVRSFVHVPLHVGDKTIGLLMLASQSPRNFTPADIRLAELWGGLAAVAIANERLYQELNTSIAARSRLLQQRDALYAVHDAILQPDSTEGILQRIADIAPAAIEVDLCQIVLKSDNPDEAVVATTTAHMASHLTGYRIDIRHANSGKVMHEGKAMIVEDAPRDTSLHPYLRTQLPCGSLIYQPMLRSDGTAVGTLVLIRRNPGSFTREQVSLAQIFAARAAAAFEITQLYDQTRRDAATKAMLLREIKHRVKNNLAGIVGLLSLRAPPMPPNAQRWLDRVVERIRALADAHGLLVEGQDRASLQELVDQTRRSLSIVTPPGVNVIDQTAGIDVVLRNQRAVSVAMVLHELCFNALVHGLSETGHVWIRARVIAPAAGAALSSPAGAHLLIVEVVDDGRGFAVQNNKDRSNAADSSPQELAGAVSARTAEFSATSSDQGLSGRMTSAASIAAEAPGRRSFLEGGAGLGLNLVREFASRELRGKFTVVSSPGEGTTARVEFPLLEDELPHGV